MSEHRIVLGPSAADRRKEARRWLARKSGESEALLVAAHSESADGFVRELAAEEGSIFGLRRQTLDSLAYRLALIALARRGLTTGSRLSHEAVTARVLHHALRDRRLGPLERVARGPGLVRALTTTLSECRLHEVSPDDLAELGELGSVLGHLLARSETMSIEHGLADRATVLGLARDGAAEIDGTAVLLDVAIENPLEASLVGAIAGRIPVCATVVEGDQSTLDRLTETLGVVPERAPTGSATAKTILDLQTYLFSDESPPTSEGSSEVVVLSAPGEAQESAELARVIQAEADEGVPFDSIAVLLRSPDVYTPLLEDAFERAGIPAHFEEGTTRPESRRPRVFSTPRLRRRGALGRAVRRVPLALSNPARRRARRTHPRPRGRGERSPLGSAPSFARAPTER